MSRSHLSSTRGKPRRRRGRYKKARDEDIVDRLKGIIGKRKTYGYLRATKKLNDQYVAEGKPRVNKKRVYRVMKENEMLLPRRQLKPTRTHDGKVRTLTSDLRWCTDIFEIQCENGQRVSVVFSLDCCDREVVTWAATTGTVDGEMVRDLMAETVEARFDDVRAAHPVQWLSDNGPQYTARETREFGAMLGLLVCTTPSYSPQSNGMAEAFVKTFKRDYVYVNDRPDAASVMRQLHIWFEDYNEEAPHSGLKMLSPREFRRANVGH